MRTINMKEMIHPESIDATAMKVKALGIVRLHKDIDDSEFLVIREIFEKYEEACKPKKQMRYRVIESKIDESLDLIFEDGEAFYYHFCTSSRKFLVHHHDRKIYDLRGGHVSWQDEMATTRWTETAVFGDIDATTEEAIAAMLKLRAKSDTEFIRDDSLFTDEIDNYKNL